MNLRFNIKEINTVTSHHIGNETPVLSTADNIKISVYINNVLDQDITAIQQSYTINIDLPNVWDKADVYFTIEKADFITYNNVITFYGYDMGIYNNYDWNSISDGFDIILIESDYRTVNERNPLHPDYIPYILNLAYSSFIGLRNPFTEEIWLYKTNSSDSYVEYQNEDDTMVGNSPSNLIISQLDYSVKMITRTYRYDNVQCRFILLDEHISSLYMIQGITWMTPVYTNIISNASDTSCFNTLTVASTISEINFLDPSYLYIDDTRQLAVESMRLTQTLYGIGTTEVDGILQGNELDQNIVNIDDTILNPDYPAEIIDSDYGHDSLFHYTWSGFKTQSIGEYKLLVDLEILDVVTGDMVIKCSQVYTINSLNWFYYEQTASTTYKLYNKSFNTVTVELAKLNDSNTFDAVLNTTISSCNSTSVNIDEDGVYKITVQRTGFDDEVILPIISYWNLHAGWMEYQKNIICCNAGTSCNDKDVYIYNTLSSQIFILFALINEVYTLGNYLDALDSTTLNKLYKINNLLSRINTYYLDSLTESSTCYSRVNTGLGCQTCSG